MKGFTTEEAAKFLGKSTRTLRRWKASGKLEPNLKIGHPGRGKGDIYSFDQIKKVTKSLLDSFEIEKIPITILLENIVSCNDKLTKTLFNLPADEYYDALQKGISIAVTEIISRGKKIQTHFKLNGGGFAALKRPLNEFDRAIFDVCNSAREANFIGITRDSLFRILTGGKNKNTRPTPSQAIAIFESLKRLMTVIEIDFSHTREKIPKYKAIPNKIISPILPCVILHNVLVNGQRTTLVRFTDESPLIKIARVKKQIINYSVSLRDITNQNNTQLVIMIKSYVIRRVLEIILHNLTPTITLADVFKHCDLTDANRWQKQDARKIVLGVMENLKSESIIKSFELTKKDGSFYGISISF